MRSKSQILSKLRADGHITDEEYKLLEQEPCDKCDDCNKISAEAYKQVACERDIAIQQLNELGYEFGEKIRTSAEKTEWIPVKFRPLTEEEQEQYPDYCYMADCPMPDEGDEILVTTTHGTVEKDEAGFDDGFYLDSGYDWQTDIVAWMPLPEPYRAEGSEDEYSSNRFQ